MLVQQILTVLVNKTQLLVSLKDSLCSLLWNLFKYYSQFSDSIQTKISQLRSPIEKELKVSKILQECHHSQRFLVSSYCLI